MLFAAGCGSGGNQGQGSAAEGSTEAGGDHAQDTTAGGSAAGNSGEEITVGDTEALVWGDGDYGVVMAHGAIYDAASWKPQAQQIAQNGMVALAVEDTSANNLIAAVDYLKEERNVQDVALMGASAGASAALQAAEEGCFWVRVVPQALCGQRGGGACGRGARDDGRSCRRSE